MGTNVSRDYKAKDEELPVMAGYVAFSLERDLTDFQAFSPIFSTGYLTAFTTQTQQVNELIFPATETSRLRIVTQRLYSTMDSLLDPLVRISGYLTLAKKNLVSSPSQFGVVALRNKINARDAEGVLKTLRVLNDNIAYHKAILQPVGLNDDMIALFKNALDSIHVDNQEQYKIVSTRRELVQANVGVLNGLYASMMEICNVGKVLYKTSNPQKLQEYTYTELIKRVRLVLPTPKSATIGSGEDNSAK
ncbi:MAG: hypothetical protein H6Q14_1467 [Bacteroidetes bacterium]|nr:hypothetical protein [Bacteroidota bacterium]